MKALDRDILRLAWPALGALVAEPLFLLTDTAMVGHLGAESLAGLGIASAILQTAIGLLIFLAYATTPAVARRLGAGDTAGAIRAGIDGMWLALGIGVVLLLAGLPTSGWLIGLFGAEPAVVVHADAYLGISLWGIPGMLLVVAANGLLRGLQDTRTPLYIATAGFAANAGLNAVLIYGLGLGVAGSALGTVIAQWAMAAVFVVIAVRAARAHGVSLLPGLAGVGSAAGNGSWLFLRTLSLRVALLATVVVGTSLGTRELAVLQIAMTVFSLLAFVLDALAIAGQALIGHGRGAADRDRVKAITGRLVRHGVLGGVVLGGAIAAVSPVAGHVFSSDPQVRSMLFLVLIAMAIGVPLAGYVFVLDGVLIGAEDARYLALTGILNLLAYLPLLLAVEWLRPEPPVVWLWLSFGLGYMAARAVTLGIRTHRYRWL